MNKIIKNNLTVFHPAGDNVTDFITKKVEILKRESKLETLNRELFELMFNDPNFNFLFQLFPEIEMKIEEIFDLIGRK